MSTGSRSRSRSPMDGSDRCEESIKHRVKFERSSGKRGLSTDCRVYVANIPFESKWQDLKDFFRQEVGNVNFVEMFNDDDGRPRGSAIVDFESSEMAQEAIEKVHKMELKGRKLILRMREDAVRSRDFSFMFKDPDRDRGNRFGRDQQSGNFNSNSGGGNFQNAPPNPYGNTYGLAIPFLDSLGITGPLVCKVFVSNLDFKVVDDDLRELFKVAGKVASAEVVKDQEGKSRGFGIVEFDHPVQAVQSISMLSNQIYFDRRLSIRMDRIAEKEQIKGPRKLPYGLKSIGMGLGCNGRPIIDISDLKDSPCVESSSGPPMNMGGVGSFNLPAANNNMGGGGMNNQSMIGLGSGVESLAMALGLGAQNMLSMTGMNPNNMNAGGPNMNSFGNQGSNSGPMNNGSSNFNSNQGLRNGVKILNLPMDYTWKTLKDMCRKYGDVKYAEIKSRGEGWVRYVSESEAKKAADILSGQRIDGRSLKAMVW